MVWSLGSVKHRQNLARDAARSRASHAHIMAAWIAVIAYNIVGVADIVSTILAIESGAGTEANPVLRAAMTYIGEGWVYAKLALQGVISFMVLWFPHWIVLTFFVVATAANAWIVYNNFSIAGVF